MSNTSQEFEEALDNVTLIVRFAGADVIKSSVPASAKKLLMGAHNQDREAYAREKVVEELKFQRSQATYMPVNYYHFDERIRELEAPITDKEGEDV